MKSLLHFVILSFVTNFRFSKVSYRNFVIYYFWILNNQWLKQNRGKNLDNNLNFKIIPASNENYLSYQLFSPHSPVSSSSWELSLTITKKINGWIFSLHRENFCWLCRIKKWMDDFLASEQNINAINSSCRCCQ